jgi:hypothetical protein
MTPEFDEYRVTEENLVYLGHLTDREKSSKQRSG